MKNIISKSNMQKTGKWFALILVVGIFSIFCLLSPTKAEAISATAVTLTATDNTQTVLTVDASEDAPTYSWDAATATLTLKGYSGKSITTNGDINLHLVGDNTLTLDPDLTNSTAYGLNLDYNRATVTADDGGTLNILGDLKTHFSAVSGSMELRSGTINIDVTTSSTGQLYGFERNVSFDNGGTGEAEINVNIERTSSANSFIYGFYNGLNIKDRENVTVNVDVKGSENDTVIAISDLYVENSAPQITASADNDGGYFKLRKVVDTFNSLSLTEGGRVELRGVVGMHSIGGGMNANTVTTTPANNNYIWIEYDNNPSNSSNYILSTLDGEICEQVVFEYSDAPAELKWVGDGIISIPEGKVDDSFSVNLLAAIRGLETYQAYYIKCEIVDGQLPEGIYLASSGGLLNGRFTAPCDAGSVTIRLREINDTYFDQSDDRTVEFTVNYGAIADKDRFLTVGNSDPVEMKSDGSGAGWSYESDTQTLTLDGYNGEPIITEGVINIHLKGNNTITLTDDNTIGIYSTYSTGEINLSADAGGTLNIKTPDNYTKSFTGIQAAMCVSGGTVNMNLSSDFTGDWYYAGIAQYGYLVFTDSGLQKGWNITLKNNNTSENKVRLYGNYNNSIHIENCGDVEINIDIRGGEFTEIYGICSLYIYNSSPDITVFTDNENGEYDCYAVNGLASFSLSEGGRIDLTGKVFTYSMPYSMNSHTVTTTPANNNYYWKDTNPNYYNESLFMADLDGNILDRVVFEYSAEPAELKWVGGTNLDIPAGAVGDYTGINFWHAIRGGNAPASFGSTNWKFEVIEGQLPSGINFDSMYNGRIEGQIIAPCTAGTVRIRATDMNGTYDTLDDRSIEFTVNHGAYSTNNPVSSLEISKDTLVLEYNGTGEILATVSPSDAAYPYVEAIIIGDSHLLVNVGEPVNGVSVITVKSFGYPGTYTVQIRTVELGITKTLTVHVKEDAPNTYINYFEERIYGFAQGESYKISGDGISTLQFVAESNYYNIPTEWFGKTINIVKVNGGNGDCDSEAQDLQIPARPTAPTGIETTDASSYESGNGKISGLESGMQYKPSDADSWYYYWVPEISVEVGSYDIRYAATNSSFAGEKITVSIGYKALAFEDRESFDIPAGYSDTSMSFYVSSAVSGGKEPYVYSIEGPDWITIDQEGLVKVNRPDSDRDATTAIITVVDGDDNSKSITINVGAVTVPHVCVFDQQVATVEYRISSADCVNKAKYYYSCICGALGSTTFESGEALGHNYIEKITDASHLRQGAEDCQSFNTYWYDCTRCDSISDEYYYESQDRGEHKYSQSFDYKIPDGHSHICTVYGCGAVDELIPHTPGEPATEHNPQICTVCSFVITPTLDHIHTPKDEWNSDENYHWHDCVGIDGYRFDEEEHIYDDVCDTDCNVCVKIRVPTSHVEEAVWVSNADTHKLIHNCCGVTVIAEEAHTWSEGRCSECEYVCLHPNDIDLNHRCDVCDGSVGVHEAADGKHTCNYCGERITDCTDENSDHKCDVCSSFVGSHEAADGKHTCDYCGETVSICSDEDGNGKCDVCGENCGSCIDSDRDHICDLHGEQMGTHSASLGKHNCNYCGIAITQCEDLNRDHKCDICNETTGTHEAADGKHTCDYCGETVSICSDEDGNGKCDVCGEAIDTPKDPEDHEHNYVDGKCECGDEDPNYVPPHEHNYVDGKCECGEEDPNYVPPHEHKFGDWICEATVVGKHYRECECGDRENGDCQWDEGRISVEPTYEADGEKTYTCTLCGGTKIEAVAKLVKVEEIVSPDNSNIKVEVPEGSAAVVAPGTVITANTVIPTISEETKGKVEVVVGDKAEILASYDISLILNGAEVQPGGVVKVTLPVPESASKYKNVQVVYIDDNGNVTACKTEMNNDGTLTFITDHFSHYAIVGVPNNSSAIWIVIAVVAVLLVGGAVVVFIFFKNKKKNETKADEKISEESEEEVADENEEEENEENNSSSKD